MKQAAPTKKLILKFNAHPGTTLKSVVDISNSLGVRILNVEDQRKTKSIAHKIVTVTGEGADDKMREALVRLPAVSFKEAKQIPYPSPHVPQISLHHTPAPPRG